EMYPTNKKVRVYCRKCEKLKKQHIVGTSQNGGYKVMVWGCFSFNGVGKIIIIRDKLNAAKYINILANNLRESAEMHHMDNFIFQQDRAPPHTAKITSNWLRDQNIPVLDWALQSPDMNLI
ncbi:transposase, partial [Pseudoloma neurophilia]